MIQSKKKWNNPLSAHQISIVVVLCLVKKPSNCLLQFLFTISNTVGNIQLLLTRSNIFLKSKLQEFAGSCCLQFCIEQIIISNSVSWQIILLQYLLIFEIHSRWHLLFLSSKGRGDADWNFTWKMWWKRWEWRIIPFWQWKKYNYT